MVRKITASIVSVAMAAALTAAPVFADVKADDTSGEQPQELMITEAEQQIEEAQKKAPEAENASGEVVAEGETEGGSEENPQSEEGLTVEISTYENLAAFIAGINDGTIGPATNAVLLGDITVPESVGNEWVPLAADWDHAYKGVFDGGGYTISGINVKREYPDVWSEGVEVHNYTAFISFLGEEGHVKDLNINANIKDVNDVAGIVSQNFGRIESCTFTGVLESNIYPNAAGEISPFYPDGEFEDYTGESGCIAAANMGSVYICSTTENTGTRIYRGGVKCGGIVGLNYNSGSVMDCVNNANVEIGETIYHVDAVYTGGAGGIAGQQEFSEEGILGEKLSPDTMSEDDIPFIFDCINNGTVISEQMAGGICGQSDGGDIAGCQNNGTVKGVTRLWGGGIVGYMGTNIMLRGDNASNLWGNVNMGEINPAEVTGEGKTFSGSYIGGIAGYVEDQFGMTGEKWAPVKVSDNMNIGKVTGRFSVGGILGLASNGLDPETKKTEIYAQVNLGEVTGNNSVGGIAGACPGVISSCINYGKVTILPMPLDPADEDIYYAGGIVGYCAWTGDVDTSINLGGIYCEGGEDKEVYIGAGAGTIYSSMTGCYYSAGTCGDAGRLIGTEPEYLKGALILPDMSGQAAKENMPELFDGKTGHHPGDDWEIMENEVIEGVTYYMPPQTGDWPLSAEDICSVGVDLREQLYSIAGAEVSAVADYTGKILYPSPTVILNGLVLTEGTDYDIYDWPYIDAGDYPLMVTGKGIYQGTAIGSLHVNKAASTVTLADKSVAYTGKPVPAAKASVKGSSGAVTYKYYSDKSCKKKIAASKVVNAGTYYAKATVAADNNYKSATSKAAKITITKAPQTLKVTQTKAQKLITLKADDVKKKAQTIAFSKVAKVTGNKTKLSYKKASGAAAFTVNQKTGKITVKKGTKKNTYTLKIKVTAAKSGNYKSASETVTVKIRIK